MIENSDKFQVSVVAKCKSDNTDVNFVIGLEEI